MHEFSVDVALLALRVGAGLVLLAHGCRKLFGWFGGKGIAGSGADFAAIGFRRGRLNALMAGLSEAVGGASLALGFLTPLAAAAVLGTMLVACSVHAPAFFALDGGYELPAVYALVATVVAVAGPGELSVDEALGHPLADAAIRVTAVALAAATGCAIAIQRRIAVRAQA
ncbi:DoxX family protein [Streptomyces cadmiisoli]|uniref:RpiR family transcriptional regulator n=1 Tax=Streptomyces cadmiisoli TaxID=2184053 RepID=A0A2Z4IS05_9ACTN|nr:DoxX family protein [Streptomyces cadmiisoli]AWW35557.1 RpiR family transcriptional regulator [Streptomyces cadmiisoli]